MAVKVFCNRATFELVAPDGEKMKLLPLGFGEVPEKFVGDITFRKAVQAGVIQVFESTKQGDKLEEAAHAPKAAVTAKAPAKAPAKQNKGDAK